MSDRLQRLLKHRIAQAGIIILAGIMLVLLCAQQSVKDVNITVDQVDAHIKLLSSDSLKGRWSFSEDIRMAEDYIAAQFGSAGLKTFPRFPDYRHEFEYTYKDRRNPDNPEKTVRLANVIGYLEGTDPQLKDEFIIFGAHHDHMGVRGDAEDNIFNGAEDNASGTTAVISLAQYYARAGGNKRSILFVTFTAEEVGMVGSRQLVKDLPVPKDKIAAMINFEMIGKPSDEGKPVCYLTGWERSDLGSIMQESLGDDPLQLIEGPEITKRLFFGSDNISFAREGVVAHTLAGIKSTNDPLTHNPDDEYETLSVENMTQIICGVVRASSTLLSGEKTPKLIQPVE